MLHDSVKYHAAPAFVRWLAFFLALLLAACQSTDLTKQKMRGTTMLQTKETGLDEAAADKSFKALARTGANAVVLIPFMRQANTHSTTVNIAESVRDDQLIAGIRRARAARLRVIVKPQMLVEGSWAGEINPGSDTAWRSWFESYTVHVLHYAQIAQNEGAEVFVVGTELRNSDRQPYWRDLIAEVRKVFKGRVTYAAHNQDGVSAYAHWDVLDTMGVTLYPSLGKSATREEMRKSIQSAVTDLELLAAAHGKSLLILEIGLPSANGAQDRPWEIPKNPVPNMRVQAMALDLWLGELNKPWVNGVFVWDWHSNPAAGGKHDTDFTVQNKPAQSVLSCHWGGVCLSY